MISKELFCWVMEHQSIFFFWLNSLGVISDFKLLPPGETKSQRVQTLHAVCALVLDVIPACDFVIVFIFHPVA